jgi:hypothetical protein
MSVLLGARHSRRSLLRRGGAIFTFIDKDTPLEWRAPSHES